MKKQKFFILEIPQGGHLYNTNGLHFTQHKNAEKEIKVLSSFFRGRVRKLFGQRKITKTR